MSLFENYLLELGFADSRVRDLKEGFEALTNAILKLDQKNINILNEYYIEDLIIKFCELEEVKNPFESKKMDNKLLSDYLKEMNKDFLKKVKDFENGVMPYGYFLTESGVGIIKA